MTVSTSRGEYNDLLVLLKSQALHHVVEIAVLNYFRNQTEFLFKAYHSPLECLISLFCVTHFNQRVFFLHKFTKNLFFRVLFIVALHSDCCREQEGLTFLDLSFSNTSENICEVRVQSTVA